MSLKMYVNTINSKFSGWSWDASPDAFVSYARVRLFPVPPSFLKKYSKNIIWALTSIQTSHPFKILPWKLFFIHLSFSFSSIWFGKFSKFILFCFVLNENKLFNLRKLFKLHYIIVESKQVAKMDMHWHLLEGLGSNGVSVFLQWQGKL